MISWPNFVSQLFNGLALGALLALISSGLTIIYGTLGVLNLAHGAMFMLGGYAGYVAYQYSGSFVVAVAAGAIFVMILGVLMERVIIRHFYQRPNEDQLLVTFGLGICFVEVVRLIFSSQSLTVPPPALFQGITNLGFMYYPTYRLAVVGIVAIALGVLFLLLYRTRLGMIVRAGIEDSVMVDSLTPGVGDDILVETFVVVVIGGVGSFPGAILGGLIAGEIISITSMFNPSYAYVMLFAAMTLVLVVRPHGLLGTAGRE
jgi:branched-chain amino acid transport system permease protein